jgi:hypothetical protein
MLPNCFESGRKVAHLGAEGPVPQYLLGQEGKMPSIQDVADQINARLNLIVTSTQDTAQNTADIRAELQQANGRLGQIESTLAIGFANLSQGIFALLQVQVAALGRLDHHSKQKNAIICELVNANVLLCDIMRRAGRLVEIEALALEGLRRLEGIAERVHGSEAGDYDRELRVIEKIERCCPPEQPPVEPCPPRCDVPDFRPRQPDTDWKPLPTPQRPDPIG